MIVTVVRNEGVTVLCFQSIYSTHNFPWRVPFNGDLQIDEKKNDTCTIIHTNSKCKAHNYHMRGSRPPYARLTSTVCVANVHRSILYLVLLDNNAQRRITCRFVHMLINTLTLIGACKKNIYACFCIVLR